MNDDTSTTIAGWHAVTAALQAGRPVTAVYLDHGRVDARAGEVETLAVAADATVHSVSRSELDRMAPDVRHQGCVARMAVAAPLDEDDLLASLEDVAAPLLLVLDGVQDPHNLGACLRSAAAAGAHAVVVPRDRAVGLTPVVRKVAAGGAERVPLARVTNLARLLRRLQAQGIWVVGTTADSDPPIDRVDLTGGLALVLGGEGGGMRRLTARTCDLHAAIPMAGDMESLNVSVAAGICLFEALRQRRGA